LVQKNFRILLAAVVGMIFLMGCATPQEYRENTDKTTYKIIEQKQKEALGRNEPFTVEPPADTLRRRLMIDQNIPYSSPASLNTKDLKPIEFWPKDNYLDAKAVQGATIPSVSGTFKIKLLDALQIYAKNSRDYQNQKETLFRAALSLDLQRDGYRNTFTGRFDGEAATDLSESSARSDVASTGLGGFSRKFLNGITLTGQISLDLLKMLNPFSQTTYTTLGDTSITIPLMRGSGKHIVSEPLTLAERNTLYAIYTFERAKRTYAVSVASEYYADLQAIDQIVNGQKSYESVVRSTRLARRQADAGKKTPIEVDQSVQQELSSRNNWISAQINFQARLDSMKNLLGLPPDAQIELDRDELNNLNATTQKIIDQSALGSMMEVDVPNADAPVELRPMTNEGAGSLEMDVNKAIEIALENRLDLRQAIGNVYDKQRAVVVAADNLRAQLDLVGRGTIRKSDGIDLEFEKGSYNSLLTLNLPIERTREMVQYRQSILDLERAVRDLQASEDSIKLNVRTRLRSLLDARMSLQIQAEAVKLAERRVSSTDLMLRAGRITMRDVLDAQQSLLQSQNSLTSARIRYRMAELELQRDLDVLQVDETGIWKEFSLQEYENERKTEK
jgi:outer membrane protein TolC